MTGDIAPPKSIWIEPTNICNLKCSWCYQTTGSMNRSKGMMSSETYQKIISEVVPFKPEISLHLAGESFLHRDLFSFIRIAKEKGLTVGITTNGTLLSKDDFAILKTGIDTINISLAGVDEDDYRFVRGTDDFANLKRDVVDLARRKNEIDSKSKIYVNVTATEQNRTKLDAFKKEFGAIEGLDGVIVRTLMDWGGSVDTSGKKITSSGFKSKIAKIVKDTDPLLSCYMVVKNIRKNKKLRNRTYCESVNSSAGILWDGTVIPCCLDFNGSIALGNINEERFMDIWNGERIRELRKSLKSVRSSRAHPVCGPCLFGPSH